MSRWYGRVGTALLLAVASLLPLSAQAGGAGTGGASRLLQEQRLSGTSRRVLMVGAHPDDEDTELLAILARGEGMSTAYLSLTRGDGGQNLIGNELGAALGVLRTEEMLAARAVDGAHQYFTRAYDFGFSKTVEEALRFWPKDSVLKDMVRVIRRFRPQVMISVWSGTAADGHGHHQAAGVLAREAFHAAGDPARYPELKQQEGLEPWQPLKYYISPRNSKVPPTLTFDGGVIDHATGLSYHQLAVRSRAQHRSQNQGRLEDLGPSKAQIGLVERVPAITGADDSLFAGIPPESPPAFDAHRSEVQLITHDVVVDATTTDDEVTPGQQLPVTLTVWNAGKTEVTVSMARLLNHEGYSIRGTPCTKPTVVAPGTVFTCVYDVTVWDKTRYDSPYFLDYRRSDGLYTWSGDRASWGEPFGPPLSAEFRISTGDRDVAVVTREVLGRFLDPVEGELRRPLAIVPKVAVDLAPDRLLWPRRNLQHSFTVSLEHLARDTGSVRVSLQVPAGWKASAPASLHFEREGERGRLQFQVMAPAGVKEGEYDVTALVVAGKDSLVNGIYRIRYPEIRPQNVITRAASKVVVADVVFPKLMAVGYVRGGGDRVPEALLNSGVPVELLTGDALERSSLAKYKVIVIGARAYEADESLVRAHPRLMTWLKAGGTLLIQYQQGPYFVGGFPPLPFALATPTADRVTDELAPVTLLATRHQALLWPNRIVAGDFDGWVQERGLDFARTWDPAWTPILETHDEGDQAREGGLLVARVGKGIAVYTGLSFNRQIPAAVPGAWRLFANLLGLGQTPVRK